MYTRSARNRLVVGAEDLDEVEGNRAVAGYADLSFGVGVVEIGDANEWDRAGQRPKGVMQNG